MLEVGVLHASVLRILSQGGCCLKDTGNAASAPCMDPCTPASTYASRMRNTLLLLERLLGVLVDTDEHAVVWEAEVSMSKILACRIFFYA